MSESQKDSVYDQMVSEVATLECVLGTLVEWDLAGKPTGVECKLASAEIVLRQSIGRLHDITSAVCNIATAPKGAAIPPNRLCCATDQAVTLDNAHNMMELVNALDCNEGTSEFEMPASGVSSLARLREMVQDAIKHAAKGVANG